MNYFQKAQNFIDGVIRDSKLSYDALMVNLEKKVSDWELELWGLKEINVFELTGEQIYRKAYVTQLIYYSERLLFKHKHSRPVVTSITITGTNLVIKTN